jgi:tetratricopeptide (TPR) repeat protein
MLTTETEELFQKGVEAVDKGNWLAALSIFEKAVQLECLPVYQSYLAACIAKERGQYNMATAMCKEAIENEPENPVHYLNLGRIYLIQGRKQESLAVFREGLEYGRDEKIIDELVRMGTRRNPLIGFLPRDNPINKYLGILLKVLKFR